MKWVVGLAVLLAVAANPAYAQNSDSWSIFTDKEEYEAGDTVVISGSVGIATGEPAVIQVFNPDGAAYRFDLLQIAADGSFTYELKIGGPLATSGMYEVRLVYGGETLVTHFELEKVPMKIHTFYIDDKLFKVPYDITGGTLESIRGDKATSTLTAMINAESDGKLVLYLPGSLLAFSGFNLNEAVVFVDEIEEFPITNNYACNASVEVPFSAGSEQIDIVQTFLASTGPREVNTVEAAFNSEGIRFGLSIVTSADTCDFSFDQESKKFHAEIIGPAHGDGYFQVTLPHHILGGPYTVLVNDQPVEFEEVFSNATRQHTTTISFGYDGVNARTIDIVGATAIPEFGSVAATVAALSIASTIAAIRFRKCQ